MSNSSLVTYTELSPNCASPRENKIIGIAIHCMVAQWTAQTCAHYFSYESTGASSTYCVGYDGSIAQSVDEADRPWTTSSRAVDSRCVTIEVASDTKPPYAVTDGAYKALIELCADICKRNNIKKLVWSDYAADRVGWKNGCNMQVHRDYEAKTCPGEYLYSRMQDVADKVNAIINGVESTPAETAPVTVNTAKGWCDVNVRVICKGKGGNDVFLLQSYLKAKNFKGADGKALAIDGDFGNNTEYALLNFQKSVFPNEPDEWDAICGKKTWGKVLEV